jgi:arylsulfatase
MKSARIFATALSAISTVPAIAGLPGNNQNAENNGSDKTKDLPNIVLINFDDVGYGDFSCNGAYGYVTPNIDSLAAQGVRFTHFLVGQPISGASRAGLLTGCYPNRIGFSGAPGPGSPYGINKDEMTMGELLKQVGYATAIFGK